MRVHPLLFVPAAIAACGPSSPEETTDAGPHDAAGVSEAADGADSAKPRDSGIRNKPDARAPDAGIDAPGTPPPPANGIPADFFNASWNHTPPRVWCPTDALGHAAAIAGARLWDDGVKWADLESTSGEYTSALAGTLSSFLGSSYAAKPGCPVNVLYTFGATPAWAALPGSDSKCAGVTTSYGTDSSSCIPPKDLDSDTADCNANGTPETSCGNGADALFQAFVYKIVSSNIGKIKYYECWNEPDGSGIFWSNSTSFGGSGHAPTTKNVPPLIRLARMCYDMMQIVHQTDPAAIVLSPSFHGPTALTWMHYFATTSVAQPGCTGACSTSLGGATWKASTITGAQTFDYTNAHLRGSPNSAPETFLEAYKSAITEIANDKLPRNFMDDEWGPVNQSSPPEAANLDILASYVARGLTLRASVFPGLTGVWFYQWDSPPGTGVSALQGNIAGTAWDVMAGWLTGSTLSACTTSGTIWQCRGTTAASGSFIVAWDTSQNCDSGCTTADHTFAGFSHYADLTGTAHAASGGVVPLGLKPSFITP
jgi:hypothetical protein